MGTITSGIGLISGLPTADLIDQLIALEQFPVQRLEGRREEFQAQRLTLLDLSARIVSLSLSASALGTDKLFVERTATSSSEGVLLATADPGASLGSFQFQPVSVVQTHQLLSSGFSSQEATIFNAGTLRISGGGFVDPKTSLDLLNGTAGVDRGVIRIIDRSGVRVDVDLTTALDVGDVLDAINQNSALGVQASVSGDHLVLTDLTGQIASNLIVEDLFGATTASDLGIVANVAANSITGDDVVQLSGNLALDLLNDGRGVRRVEALDDLRITLKDSTAIDVNLDGALDLADVLDLINNDSENTGDLTASIASDGVSIALTDSSGGGGTLTVTALNSSNAAADLGLLGTEQGGGVLDGSRLIAGLNTVLLSSLNGGAGITTPGSITVTDRLGVADTIDLSGADTLGDVIDAINGSGAAVTATINAARNGITITDNSAGGGNLTLADVGPGTVAADLGIAIDSAVNSVDSGDRNRQYVNENTALDSLGGSGGVTLGKLKITDSAFGIATIDLGLISAKTLGDVIDAVNNSGIGVTAAINATGDGLSLTDTAGGSGTLTVEEVDGSSTAADLRIKGSATGGVINGSLETVIDLTESDTLQDVIKKINESGAAVSAAIINDGSGVNPFRLSLVSTESGSAGALLVDSSDAGFSVSTTVRPEDAVLRFGSGVPGTESLLLRSTDNSFQDVLPGLTIDVLSTSTQPVTVSVSENRQATVDAVQSFVDDFNSAVSRIDEVTSFNVESEESAILQGDGTVLQIQRRLNDLVLARLPGLENEIRSSVELGLRFNSQGELTFDESKLLEHLENDPDAVRDFFKTEDTGFADQLESLIESFTDTIDGSITVRADAIDQNVVELDQRILAMQARIKNQRDVLVRQFAFLETTLAQLNAQLDAISSFQSVAPLSFRRSSNRSNNN